MKKGQFSIEFIIILGVLLFILASISMPLYSASRGDAQKLTDLSLSREAANKLAEGLNEVYSSGIGTKTPVEYSLPSGISNIIINESGAGGDNRVKVQIQSSKWGENISVKTLLPVGYPIIEENLKATQGKHTVVIESLSIVSDNLKLSLREC